MVRVRPAQDLAARQGIILLVVITLLTLFAVVGITFVLYAQAEASSMRAARQSETLTQPDADPEMLLTYYLSQLIYGAGNNPLSAMQNWDLATNMYGMPGNTVPFNGTGRLKNAPTGWNLNYATNGGSLATDGVPNPPYTYPDVNSLFLAAIQAGPNMQQPALPIPPGAVLIPSFCRWAPSASGPPTWNTSVRAGLPFLPEDGMCDVKNLASSPGLYNPNNQQLTPNDSIWMDLGFPMMTSANGQRFKPLFAAMIQDLDGRANVNMHGNLLGSLPNGTAPFTNASHQSHQGWGPGEINLGSSILTMNNEGPNLLLPNGRYDPTKWNAPTNEVLKNAYAFGGHFYSATDMDASPSGAAGAALTLPTTTTAGWGFPQYGASYGNGWWTAASPTNTEAYFNPVLFNLFDPTQNYYNSKPEAAPFQYRVFPASDMEALLRYGDTGSPALTSDLFNLCPQSCQMFQLGGSPATANNKALRLLTTHSFDISAPGVMPCINTNPANLMANQYQLAQPAANAPPGYPTLAQTVPQLAFPAASPNSGEFGANWNAMSSASTNLAVLKRIDLNRGFPDYPTLSATTYQFNPPGNLSYPLLPPGANNPQATYATALQSRQIMAQEIFDVLCTVTGASCTVQGNGKPILVAASATTGTPPYDALRWLAQLAVNIVDFVNFSQAQQTAGTTPAPDDIMTSFNWNSQQTNSVNNGWVFGTVLPRLVLNEAFIHIANNPSDPGLKPPTAPPHASRYDINCWVELHNPFSSDTGASKVNTSFCIPTTLGGNAQLYFGTPPNGYAGYRVIACQTGTGAANDNTKVMVQNDNVLGVPQNIVSNATKGQGAVVVDSTAYTAGSLNNVLPNFSGGKMQAGTAAKNNGFYVMGPQTQPASMSTINPTLAVQEQAVGPTTQNDATLTATLSAIATNNNLAGVNSSMHYPIGNTGATTTAYQLPNPLPSHTIALQRLACPYMAQQPNPANANFNPYVTVDYILSVPTYDAVTTDGTGPLNNHTSTTPNANYSSGRNQPYAADGSQLIPQGKSAAAGQPPGNTFFSINGQSANNATQQWAYDWLFHANRPLVSPIELLQVSGYKPHQLTQMFMTQKATPQNPVSQGIFQHRAPWITQSQLPTGMPPLSSPMIYRALEFFEAGLRPQWTPLGGRFPGKININTLWDPCAFVALCDPQANNFFTQASLYPTLYNAFATNRTPMGAPGPNDMPYYSLAAPFAQAAGQYPNGCGIQNTLLRPDTNAANLANNPLKLLLEPPTLANGATNPTPPPAANPPTPGTIGHPYLRMELLNKIFNNVTTRSNVFAVWLTVGFFDMSTGQLGLEVNKAEGRNVRHRMFAIIDRTNLTIALNPQGQPAVPLQQGPRPFFINSLSAVTQAQVGQANTQINLPTAGGNYEDSTWSLQTMQNQGMLLVVDSGPNQEILTTWQIAGNQITATFQKPHPIGFAISNAALGNPGPQPFFDPRNPQFSGVVRYFSIIQ